MTSKFCENCAFFKQNKNVSYCYVQPMPVERQSKDPACARFKPNNLRSSWAMKHYPGRNSK